MVGSNDTKREVINSKRGRSNVFTIMEYSTFVYRHRKLPVISPPSDSG